MRRDVIAEVEQVTGKHWSQFTNAENALALIASAAESRRVEETYKALGDTNWGTTWSEFKTLIQHWGFAVVLLDTFPNPHETTRTEELMVAWHDAKGLLLEATSYGDKINGGTVYAEVAFPAEMDWREGYRVLGSFSGGMVSEKEETPIRYDVSYDVREGLLSTLERLELGGLSYCPTWKTNGRPRHLWLVDYSQTREDHSRKDHIARGGFYDHCTAERVARLPEHIQERIGRRCGQ